MKEARPASSAPAARAYREADQPKADEPLRDLFDLSMLSEDPSGKARKNAPATADAMALFRDDPAPRRKPMAAEARLNNRRCKTCGGVVPAGMSICSTCGLDQETGIRVELDEDLGVTSSGPRRDSMPVGILVVGLLLATASVGLSVASLIGITNGLSGAEFLLVICLFGVFASIQFLRLKSVKPLFVAMTLGVMVNVVAMIGLPVYNAVTDVETVQQEPNPSDDDDGVRIKSLKESLDVNRLTWGIAIVFSYATISVYLNSASVRRQFERR